MCTKVQSENLKGRDHSEDVGVDENVMDRTEIGSEDVNWTQLDQDRVLWRALLNTVMNLQLP